MIEGAAFAFGFIKGAMKANEGKDADNWMFPPRQKEEDNENKKGKENGKENLTGQEGNVSGKMDSDLKKGHPARTVMERLAGGVYERPCTPLPPKLAIPLIPLPRIGKSA